MKKWFTLMACAIVPGALSASDASQAEILRKIEEMQQQIQQQQAVINELKAELDVRPAVTGQALSEVVKREVDAAVEQGLAQVSDEPYLKLGSSIDGLQLKGDLRLRYEYRQGDGDAQGGVQDARQKSRFRTRFRLGMVWKNSTEDWEIGAGLATGGADGTSTNASWGDNTGLFETDDIRLDYAYAKHKFNDCTSLTLGQHKNPFVTSWLLWDSDLRPTGVTFAYDGGAMFATLGAYNVISDWSAGEAPWANGVRTTRDDSLSNMYGMQVGAKAKGENMEALLALGYFLFDHENIEQWYGEDTLTPGQDDYNFQIGDAYGHVKAAVGEVGLTAYGQVFKNFGVGNGGAAAGNAITQIAAPPAIGPNGYDSEDNDMGWTLGLDAKFDKFSVGYAYGRVEGDSAPAALINSDFGDGLGNGNVNVQGHKLSAKYSMTKHCSVAVTAMFTEEVETDVNNDDLAVDLYQFDLSYKF